MLDLDVRASETASATLHHESCSTAEVARLPKGPVRALWLSASDGLSQWALRRLGPGERVVIGSGSGADVLLADKYVSAAHCAVTHLGRGVLVEDMGSRNGVFVGGATIIRAELSPGTAFAVGDTVIHVADINRDDRAEGPPLRGIVGTSPAMRRLAHSVRRLAQLALPVLIRGESGSGKELVARALHDEGPRARGPFIAINAAAISRELAESDLFGHERGAFTGALKERRGAFREAHGGTLFLDEIAALPADLQPKLLRVVEESLVRPVGGEKPVAIDVRLVAATCEPIESMVLMRKFRADVFERIAATTIHVPALRERRDDLPALASHLLRGARLSDRRLTPDALAILCEQEFPGNVRQLRNVLVQAAMEGEGAGPIQAEHVLAVVGARKTQTRIRLLPHEAKRILDQCGGNLSAAARNVGIPRTTLRNLARVAERQA